jgi:hypothetical protein
MFSQRNNPYCELLSNILQMVVTDTKGTEFHMQLFCTKAVPDIRDGWWLIFEVSIKN